MSGYYRHSYILSRLMVTRKKRHDSWMTQLQAGIVSHLDLIVTLQIENVQSVCFLLSPLIRLFTE